MKLVRNKGDAARQGFTLIELLVSVVILSVGIVAILHAFERSLFALGAARDHLWSSLLINEKTAEIDIDLRAGDGSQIAGSGGRGDFDEPYDAFSWESTIGEYGIQEQEDGQTNKVFSAEVTVWRRGSGVEHSAQTLFNQ